ncbi:MAG: ATP-binding cassette domain-containing protein, partial [[Mycobacterium] stephanolepidis]
MTEAAPLIRFENVSKTFRVGKKTVTAVDDVSLDIDAGDVFAMIGYSGAGKSTLVRLINGLERPSSGRVVVDGAEVSALGERELRSLRTDVGMIFQQFNLFRSRTVAGNIAYPL